MTKNIKSELNIGMVRRMVERDPISKVILQHFASKERSRAETTVQSLTQLTADGRRLTRGEIITTFKSLETAGAGVFYAGRRGKPSRFSWACDLVQMAKDALGSGTVAKIEPVAPAPQPASESATPTVGSEIVAKPTPAPAPEASLTPAESPSGTKTYFFPLRKDRELQIDLPKDLTQTESTRLSQFLQSLGH